MHQQSAKDQLHWLLQQSACLIRSDGDGGFVGINNQLRISGDGGFIGVNNQLAW
jgi:hypothetical protein